MKKGPKKKLVQSSRGLETRISPGRRSQQKREINEKRPKNPWAGVRKDPKEKGKIRKKKKEGGVTGAETYASRGSERKSEESEKRKTLRKKNRNYETRTRHAL